MTGIITYSKIREIQREEKSKKEFYKLPENFVEQIQDYIKEKKELMEKNSEKKNLFSQDLYNRVEYEIKNALRAIISIFQTRQEKMMEKAFLSSKTGSKIEDYKHLLGFEKEFYDSMLEKMKEYREEKIVGILEGKKTEKKEKSFKSEKDSENQQANKLVRMLENVPSFVGEDNKTLGPFQKGDVVNISEKISGLLIRQGKAEKL